ncbi:hypothetical protein Nepgr_032076 [Nepenthes gracilis]|uniref:GBF-interacting protein 1 N-terminal domain-containing protein n=1 Tax=Nepenthes gracilis TaxID=150966 RepID=A0AAD3TJT0_NEPGR|nr:hypothetical protein Nepgr_032076 [Nepenthes gracilis]
MSTTRVGGNYGVNGNKGNDRNNSDNSGVASIPAASKKMIQSLKEIVNCPELEIYAMLKECNMDPNEAVNRLLSQDPFHEVKSKREKKKEIKDAADSRSHGAPNRGGRGGADCYGGSMPQLVSTELGASRGKPTHKKGNGAVSFASSLSSSAGLVGIDVNRRAPLIRDASMDNKALTIDTSDGISSSDPTSGFKLSWSGIPGQESIADIVKKGMLQGKASSNQNPTQQSFNHHHLVTPSPSLARPHDLHSSQSYALESGGSTGQHVSPSNDWPLDEQPLAASMPYVSDPTVDSGSYTDPSNSNLQYDRTAPQYYYQTDEVWLNEDGAPDDAHADLVQTVPETSRKIQEASSCRTFDDVYKNSNTYQVQRHAFDEQEVEDANVSVSAVATNLHQLSFEKQGEDSPSEAGSPAVKIPDHLQVQSADCSHLSFGSFGSGMIPLFSRPVASTPVKCNFEEASAATDASSVGHSDTRVDHLRTASDGDIAHRLVVSAGSYDSPLELQPDMLKQGAPEVSQGSQYSFTSSTADYTFGNNQQLNLSLAHSQTSPQAYSNSLPRTLFASSVHSVREAKLSYLGFPTTQSMPTKYSSSSVSSVSSSPTISITEALKTGNFSSPQPTQNLQGSTVPGPSALPQHLSVNPYLQPSLPLGHFGNMIGYPFLPQSYTLVPSAFPRTFAGNSNYHHQSIAAALPQYKNSISVSSLPQSAAAAASGYGGFGSSTNVPGNFPANPPTAPSGTSTVYENILSSQYKDSNHMLSLPQQNENSPLWVLGPGSRAAPAVPAGTYYSFHRQSQQPPGLQQSQQPPSQHYANLGCSNFYYSQTAQSTEHQQRDNPTCLEHYFLSSEASNFCNATIATVESMMSEL